MQEKIRNIAKNVVSVANYKPPTWFLALMMLIAQSFLGTAAVQLYLTIIMQLLKLCIHIVASSDVLIQLGDICNYSYIIQ